MATKKNLNANAENGSLLSINGFVVIKAEDQRITNINGNILTIYSYKLKLSNFCKFSPNLRLFIN